MHIYFGFSFFASKKSDYLNIKIKTKKKVKPKFCQK